MICICSHHEDDHSQITGKCQRLNGKKTKSGFSLWACKCKRFVIAAANFTGKGEGNE